MKFQIIMKRPLALFPLLSLLAVLAPEAARGELEVSADFPGGAAEILELDQEARLLRIRPPAAPGRGWPCWWYLRIDGATAGEELRVTVEGNPGRFRPGGAALAAHWAQPEVAAISVDGQSWGPTPAAERDADAKTATYRIAAPGARFWLAWGPPFLPGDADAALDRALAAAGSGERYVLAETREGRAVPAIRLGREGAGAAVWVQARQHAWESGSSWVARGFLEWISGEDPEALALREAAEIHVVPIMDVDNVVAGAGGKDAVPRDHNRDWADRPVYPEVAAAQERLLSLLGEDRLRLFLDLHNPAPGDRQCFFFGPFDYESMEGAARVLHDRWLALAVEEAAGGPLPLNPAYRFATYIRTEEERGRMSAGWARLRSDPARTVAVTLETSWNHPQGHAASYLEAGRRLGMAVARHIEEIEFRKTQN